MIITADHLRASIFTYLEDEFDLDNIQLQGKRIVVEMDGDTYLILVTKAKALNERKERNHE